MNFRWFISKTIRQATEMHRQVRKLLQHQRDLLSPPAVEGLTQAMSAMEFTLASSADRAGVKKQMEELEKAANKWLKPYPSASIRENIEVFLVAIAVAVGIRTFFVQPFKIPTGSMQPTLFGVTFESLRSADEIPGSVARFFEFWVRGVSYAHETAEADGPVTSVGRPSKFLLFNLRQEYTAGGSRKKIWFPEDRILDYAGVTLGRFYRRGEDIIPPTRIHSGDHLFVNRLTYNFRKPHRGEIIVFATAGTAILQQDQFYIKRLVALGGEKVSIGDDQHLVIDGQRLDASTEHFENVYSFQKGQPPANGLKGYFGHANDVTGKQVLGPMANLAPYFRDASSTYEVPSDAYLAFGDNTLNSSDSRSWGPVPQQNVIGKSFFVYWPITSRFGLDNR